MAEVTLQILDGVDRGKVFQRLGTPVSIGREEGNTIQLNDERVSRYHAKIQEDQGQLVLTDLESTNGTRVNGEPVPLIILRLGDRISVGRSVLLVGSPSELDDLVGSSTSKPAADGRTIDAPNELIGDKTRPAAAVTDYSIDGAGRSEELKFQLNFHDDRLSPMPQPPDDGESTPRAVPGLPGRLSPAQAAQLAELLLYLHQRLGSAVEDVIEQTEDGGVRLSRATWQRILRVEMEIARYHYRIGHPD
jgi:pSer/pThr/pTyr-binding forkhead associated (FHA) protein